MKIRQLAIVAAGVMTLGACASHEYDDPIAPAPPVGPGAIAGTIAADRDGDGYVDGYYTPDGVYHPVKGPPCPPPPPPPSRSGERG